MLVGYARVSTEDQDTRLQRDALLAAGVERIVQEKGSGVGPRPELHRTLETLQPGDVLVVWKIDRLARSSRHLWDVVDHVKARGAGFRSLTEPIDTSSPMGEFVLQILGAVAQLERALIHERCEAGRVAAKARGVVFGRRPLVVGEHSRACARLYRAGFTIREISMMLDVSYSGVRAALVRERVTFRPRFLRF